MLDFPEKSNASNLRDSANDDVRRRDDGLVSEAAGVPLLIDEPAPLSDALHIPTLIDEKSETKAPDATSSQPAKGFDKFGRNRAADETDAPQNTNRATTPAGAPRHDAATLIGVPSNHPQTPAGAKLAKLDKVALFLGAIIVIGPLAAAMLGRMGM